MPARSGAEMQTARGEGHADTYTDIQPVSNILKIRPLPYIGLLEFGFGIVQACLQMIYLRITIANFILDLPGR